VRTAALIFPHQLYSKHPVLAESPEKVVLIEDSLFFSDRQYPMQMHAQKIAYHRETMAGDAKSLQKTVNVEYLTWSSPDSQIGQLFSEFASSGFDLVTVCDVHDFSLEKRLRLSAKRHELELKWLPAPMFLNTVEDNVSYRSQRKRWFMADFYQWQRKRFDVLMDDGKPRGGKWSFDEDNRKKYPKKAVGQLPVITPARNSAVRKEVVNSVTHDFPQAPGEAGRSYYPSTHKSASAWLDVFLEERFEHFGIYEDAIVPDQGWLYHSVLTPMLNIGLLTPKQILDRSMTAADSFDTPLNSVEGFIRQIIGWREFMRATYDDLGVTMRTTNHWQHHRPMPESFYQGTTGIEPVDNTIHRILETGYCHHIERLMVLGGFMFLCEIDPDDIYRWFMEMFIDSYDWVMVPNVYAMSQNADGGLITTKPYFSGSNYILKMSHYKKGEWSEIWDALFWRWILLHKKSLAGNPRWAMMCRNADRLDPARVKQLKTTAETYLKSLDK